MAGPLNRHAQLAIGGESDNLRDLGASPRGRYESGTLFRDQVERPHQFAIALLVGKPDDRRQISGALLDGVGAGHGVMDQSMWGWSAPGIGGVLMSLHRVRDGG